MQQAIKNFRFALGGWMNRSPLLFRLNSFRPAMKERIVTAQTDLCFEGFQRSGNSYFSLLFSRANKDKKLAHHIHAPQQLHRALKFNIPAVLLIRDPADAVASLLTWDSRLSPELALKSWIQFHESLLPIKERLCIVQFDALVQDYNQVIETINDRFETDFIDCRLNEEQISKLMKRHKQRGKANDPFPNEKKKEQNAKNKEVVLSLNEFFEAETLYLKF